MVTRQPNAGPCLNPVTGDITKERRDQSPAQGSAHETASNSCGAIVAATRLVFALTLVSVPWPRAALAQRALDGNQVSHSREQTDEYGRGFYLGFPYGVYSFPYYCLLAKQRHFRPGSRYNHKGFAQSPRGPSDRRLHSRRRRAGGSDAVRPGEGAQDAPGRTFPRSSPTCESA